RGYHRFWTLAQVVDDLLGDSLTPAKTHKTTRFPSMSANRNPPASQSPSRRTWIKAAATLAGTAAIAPAAYGHTPAGPKRLLRLAHLTDVHVQPELNAERGMAACLHHAQSLADPPQLILTGG